MYKRGSKPEMGEALYSAVAGSVNTGKPRDLSNDFEELSKRVLIANKLAAYKLQGRDELGKLNISIENKAGTYRHWYDPHNKRQGKTLQKYDYGYIRGSEGMDGDHVDCYIGPNRTAKMVYVITTNKGPDFSKEDEQKCMLGFGSEAEAKQAFLDHYDNPKFFRSMKAIPFKEFEEKVLATKEKSVKKVARDSSESGVLSPERLRLAGRVAGLTGLGFLTHDLITRFPKKNPRVAAFVIPTAAGAALFTLADRAERRKTAAERDLDQGQFYEQPRNFIRSRNIRMMPASDMKGSKDQMTELFRSFDEPGFDSPVVEGGAG